MDFDSLHNQHAVYWAPGPPGIDTKPTYLPAVEIKCRWEDTVVELKDPAAKDGVFQSKTQVFSTVRLRKNGYLWEGTYSNLVDVSVPSKNPEAVRIEMTERTPSVEADEVEYIAYA